MAMLLIKNGLIHNAVDRNPFIADILVDNKKIVKIEPDMFWDGAEVYDAAGSEIYPGFVEAHAHTGCPAMALATKDMTIMNWEILFLHSFAPLMELNPGMKPCWRREMQV